MPLTVVNVSYPLAKVSSGTAGGAEQVLAALDKALVLQGDRSLVIAPEGSRCHGLLVSVTIPSGVLDEAAKREARYAFKRALQRTLARYPVDVVHMHGLDFFEYFPDADVPVVVSLHLPLDWYSREALRPTPNVTLVCVSEYQARTACPEVEIDQVIPNGVDLNEFGPSGRLGNYGLVMGRICPEKGFHLAVEAAEQAGIELLIAGNLFEYREHRVYFDSKIAPRLNARIRFVGPVGGERKRSLLAGARCLLIPSQVPETSSLIAMEAMACETPVIAWRIGALPEIVGEGRTGFLVASVEEMTNAIGRVHRLDRHECRREAERRFDAGNMISKYLALYEKVASRTPKELQAA